MSKDSVVVPREPTEAMLEAGYCAATVRFDVTSPDAARQVWVAMLEAHRTGIQASQVHAEQVEAMIAEAPQPADLRERVARVEREVERRIAMFGDRPNGDTYRAAWHEAFLFFRDEIKNAALLQPSPVEQKDG